jgi:dTDP-4-amino-4,6-dideoxygalactose transaminase
MASQDNGNKRIWLASPTTHGEEMEFIREAFETNWVAPLGKNVDEFEKELAALTGAGHCVALSSGTSAIHLALKLAGVKDGDRVFCPSLTFVATANPILYERATPVFVDSEDKTWNMDPEALEAVFAKYPKPKAVLLVHLYGTPAQVASIRALCNQYGVPLIEDAAESLGATYRGAQTGSYGDLAILSFNGNKIITTSGGGALLTQGKALADKARFLATQAREAESHYEHREMGYNYRMSNISAGIGRGQLLHLSEHIRRKTEIYETYREGLAGLPVTMNPYLPESVPNHWLSCVLLDDKAKTTPEDIRLALEAENIEARPLWKPMHQQPLFREFPYVTTQGDLSARLFDRGLCLPSDVKMTPEEQQRVIALVRGVLEG